MSGGDDSTRTALDRFLPDDIRHDADADSNSAHDSGTPRLEEEEARARAHLSELQARARAARAARLLAIADETRALEEELCPSRQGLSTSSLTSRAPTADPSMIYTRPLVRSFGANRAIQTAAGIGPDAIPVHAAQPPPVLPPVTAPRQQSGGRRGGQAAETNDERQARIQRQTPKHGDPACAGCHRIPHGDGQYCYLRSKLNGGGFSEAERAAYFEHPTKYNRVGGGMMKRLANGTFQPYTGPTPASVAHPIPTAHTTEPTASGMSEFFQLYKRDPTTGAAITAQLSHLYNTQDDACLSASVLTASSHQPREDILVDSGAGKHLWRHVPNANTASTTRLSGFEGHTSTTSGTGSIHEHVSPGVKLSLESVGEVRNMPHDIVSVGQLALAGHQLHIWSPSNAYVVTPAGAQIPVHLDNGVLWMTRQRPPPLQTPLPSPVHAIFQPLRRVFATLASVSTSLRDARLHVPRPNTTNPFSALLHHSDTDTSRATSPPAHPRPRPTIPPGLDLPVTAYPVGRTRVSAADLPQVLHKLALHCSDDRLRYIAKFAPFCTSVPEKYWSLGCSCFTCIHANGRAPKKHHSRTRQPTLPTSSPSAPRPLSRPQPCRPFEHFVVDTVYPRCGSHGIVPCLFGADVGSGVYTFDVLHKKRGVVKAFRQMVKEFRLNEQGYMVTVHSDNEPNLIAQLREAVQDMAWVRLCPLPENSPWTSAAERGWKWLSAAGRALLIDSKLGDDFRVRALKHAAVHHLFLPQRNLGGQTPISVINRPDLPIYDGNHSLVDLAPFGCQAYAVKTDPNRGSPLHEPLDTTARTRPGIVTGYKDRFASGITIRIDRADGTPHTVFVNRRHCHIDPSTFPGRPDSSGLPQAPPLDTWEDYDTGFEPLITTLPDVSLAPPTSASTPIPPVPFTASLSPASNNLDRLDCPPPSPTDRHANDTIQLDDLGYLNPTTTSLPATTPTDSHGNDTINLDDLGYLNQTTTSLPASTPIRAVRRAGCLRAPLRKLPGPTNLPCHITRLAALISLIQMVGSIQPEHHAAAVAATLNRPDVQDVMARHDLTVPASVQQIHPKRDDLSYLDLVDSLRQSETHSAVGGSALDANFYIPKGDHIGITHMAAAQVDLSWKRTLSSTNRDAALQSLDKEVADLVTRALDPVGPDHPEFAAACDIATPARAILSVKRDGRWKTRICVRGDLQDKVAMDGPDFVYYTEASQAASFRALLFRGNRPQNFIMGTVDVSVAFLQSNPFPPGTPARYMWFRHPLTGVKLYFRQRTSIYGECGAPKRWAETLGNQLQSQGFIKGENDPSVYYNSTLNVSLIVHVDDIFFEGPPAGVHQFLSEFETRFDIKPPIYLTEATPIDFLGLIIARDATHIYLSMEPYIRQSIDVMAFDVSALGIVHTPFTADLEGGDLLGPAEKKRYMMGTGAIGWMTAARPDLSFVHSRLAQHLAQPTACAMEGLRHAYAYIAQTPCMCLGQALSAPSEWTFYTDSDFGGNTELTNKMRPQLGILARCGGTPVHFSSKHPKVAFAHRDLDAHADTGIAGPEIYALGNGVADFLGLSYVIEELGLPPIRLPMEINVDNSTAVAFAGKSVKRTRLRHIDTRQWWVRAVRDKKLCTVQHIPTALNLSDFFTKGLARVPFVNFRDQLMTTPPLGTLHSLTAFA